jgi:hypothetical protein
MCQHLVLFVAHATCFDPCFGSSSGVYDTQQDAYYEELYYILEPIYFAQFDFKVLLHKTHKLYGCVYNYKGIIAYPTVFSIFIKSEVKFRVEG